MQANIAWAYAVLMHSPGPELLDAIAREAEKKLAEFTSQNISNLVYAFAKLEHVPAGFLERASQAARTLLGQFTPQVGSQNLLTSSSRATVTCGVLLQPALEAECSYVAHVLSFLQPAPDLGWLEHMQMLKRPNITSRDQGQVSYGMAKQYRLTPGAWRNLWSFSRLGGRHDLS